MDLSSIEITFRVIELPTNNDTIKKEITRTNNTQNTILSKDFISQDPVQEELQKQIGLLGYVYQIKRDNSFKSGEKSFDIDEVIESLVITFLQPNLAAIYRKEVGRLHVLVVKQLSLEKNLKEEWINYNYDDIKKMIISTVEAIYSYCEKQYEKNYLRTLFQNVQKCQDVYGNSLPEQ